MTEPERGVREDGGYVGKCTGCHGWYWNSWGAGTYCGACLHGYCETIKGHWDDADTRAERLDSALHQAALAIVAIYQAGFDSERKEIADAAVTAIDAVLNPSPSTGQA